MPFNKKSKEEISLPKALGIDDKRADQILKDTHELVHEGKNHHEALMVLNENLDDNELLFATYAYGRMVESHEEIAEHAMGKLDEIVKDFMGFLDGITTKKKGGVN